MLQFSFRKKWIYSILFLAAFAEICAANSLRWQQAKLELVGHRYQTVHAPLESGGEIVVYLSPQLDSDIVDSIANAISKVNVFLSPQFVSPHQLKIIEHSVASPAFHYAGYIVSSSFGLTSRAMSGEINRDLYLEPVPRVLDFFPEVVDSQIRTQFSQNELVQSGVLYQRNEGPIIHEYGHALMFEKLLRESGLVGLMAMKMKEWAQIIDLKSVAEYYKRLSLTLHGAERKRALKSYTQFIAKHRSLGRSLLFTIAFSLHDDLVCVVCDSV